jgi:toxin CptA
VQFPILIGLRRSRILVAGLAFVVLTVLGIGLYFLTHLGLQVILCLLTAYLAFITWQKLTPKISEIRLERGGSVSIRHDNQQEFFPASIQPNATVHPWLTVFRVTSDSNQAFTLIATVDTLNRQNFRRLRVFLRWQADLTNGAGRDAV